MSALLAGRDLLVRIGQRRRQLGQRRAAPVDDLRAVFDDDVIPVVQLVGRRACLADGAQQVVALGQGATVGRHRRPRRGHGLDDERVKRLAPAARRADDEQHVLGRKQDDRQCRSKGGWAAGHAVDQDALAPAARAAAAITTSTVVADAVGPGPGRLEPRELGAPRDQLAVVAGRCERDVPSTTSDSRRLVLPVAFGPTTTCGPPGKSTSRHSYERNDVSEVVLRASCSGAPPSGGTGSGRRAHRHDHVDIVRVVCRLDHARATAGPRTRAPAARTRGSGAPPAGTWR